MSDILGYALSSFLLEGAWIAIEITALAMIVGLFLGLVLALMRLSRFKLLSGVAWGYIWLMRGTPLLLQLVFIFDALPRLGIRFGPLTTAVIGFGLNEAAFAAEFIRGGILAVNRNQTIAAASLGMGPMLTLRRIILPQAMRAILPQISNATISMLKGTSLASVIFVNELTFRAQQIMTEEEWDSVVAVHLKGFFNETPRAAPSAAGGRRTCERNRRRAAPAGQEGVPFRCRSARWPGDRSDRHLVPAFLPKRRT